MNADDFDIGRAGDCASDLALDRFLAGELAGSTEGERLETHLGTCARCSGRHAALAAEAERFGEEVFVQGLAAQAARRSRKAPVWARIAGACAAAAAAVALFFVPAADEGFRTKGSAALALIAKTDEGVARIYAGDTLAPGDAIRFEVEAPRDAWVAILGLDSAQVVTPYVAGAAIAAGEEQVLPGSIVLDETLGPERIVAVFCEAPIPPAKLVDAGMHALARAGGDPAGSLDLGLRGCVQSSVLIEKREKR